MLLICKAKQFPNPKVYMDVNKVWRGTKKWPVPLSEAAGCPCVGKGGKVTPHEIAHRPPGWHHKSNCADNLMWKHYSLYSSQYQLACLQRGGGPHISLCSHKKLSQPFQHLQGDTDLRTRDETARSIRQEA